MHGEHIPAEAEKHAIWSCYPVPLFALLLAFLLYVFFFAPVSVTLDGYTNLYTAKVLGEMLSGHPEVHRSFFYNSPLLPIWIGPLLLTAISTIVPDELALKILIVMIGIALLSSLYFCIDVSAYRPHERAQVLIVLLPFAWNAFVTYGFYSFLISASLFFVVLGMVLRYGLGMSLRLQSLIPCLLLVAYFTHPLPVLISFLFPFAHFIGEAITQGRVGWRSVTATLKRHAFESWPWVPVACLILRFSVQLARAAAPQSRPAISEYAFALTYTLKHRTIALVRDAVVSISPTPSVGTLFIALLGILLAGLILRPRKPVERDRRRFTSLTVLMFSTLFLYLVLPESVGEGSWIPVRFLLYASCFCALAALTGGVFDPHLLTLCSLVGGLSVAGFAGEYLIVSRLLAPAVAELRLATDIAPKHSRVLILAYQMMPTCKALPLLERSSPQYHLALASALKNQLIVLNGTQAVTAQFPLRYSGTRSFPSLGDQPSLTFEEKSANWHEVLKTDTDVDFVVSWGTPNGSTWCKNPVKAPFEEMLRLRHDLVFSKEGTSRVQLWQKRR